MSEQNDTSLYSKVLNKEGVLGLLVFMFALFLMTIIYRGQQENHEVLSEIQLEAEKQTRGLAELAEVMKDIRYSIKSQAGITFRN